MYTEPSHTTSLRDFVYRDLKRGLLIGEYGIGGRLGEERLAERFGVSRTPVREALMRLFSEGLVCPHPDGGYRPVAPDVPSMRHLYEVRIALELEALHRPVRLGTTHDHALLAALHADWVALLGDDLDPDPEFVLLDESFHCGLAEAAGNPVLVELLQQVNERIRIARMQDFLIPGRIVDTVAQHTAIVERLLDRDLDGALARFEAHVGESFEHVTDQVLRALDAMEGASAEVNP